MRKVWLFLGLVCLLFSASTFDVLQNFTKKNYKKTCLDGARLLYANRFDETFVNAVAYSCLQVDMLDPLGMASAYLRNSKTSRQNAAFYATILFQKKMLYLSLVDGIDISSIRTPKTKYILSKIFDKYVKKEYKKIGNTYKIKDEDRLYKISIISGKKIKKIKIEEYINNKPQKVRFYW